MAILGKRWGASETTSAKRIAWVHFSGRGLTQARCCTRIRMAASGRTAPSGGAPTKQNHSIRPSELPQRALPTALLTAVSQTCRRRHRKRKVSGCCTRQVTQGGATGRVAESCFSALRWIPELLPVPELLLRVSEEHENGTGVASPYFQFLSGTDDVWSVRQLLARA